MKRLPRTAAGICFACLAFSFSGWSAESAVNLLKGATASASTIQNDQFAAAKAVDGDMKSRWSSKTSDNQWLLLELDSAGTADLVVLRWEAAAAREYAVMLSGDGERFEEVFHKTDGKPNEVEVIRFAERPVKAIRIDCRTRATQHGFSLWEVEAFHRSGNLALFAKAEASSVEKSGLEANKAVDGNRESRWASKKEDNQFLQLDLGRECQVGRIVLRWERAAAKEYSVGLSTDGVEFTEVFSKTDGQPGATETIRIEPVTARHIRVDCRTRVTQHGFSLWEVEVY